MATKPQVEARVQWCLRQLIDGRATHRVVSDLADREGISRRQARRVVGVAYLELQKDLDVLSQQVGDHQQLGSALFTSRTLEPLLPHRPVGLEQPGQFQFRSRGIGVAPIQWTGREESRHDPQTVH